MNTFKRISHEISVSLRKAASDKNADWQRVNSYIADILKDAHVLYAKLARVQGDFSGQELDNLEKISEDVLSIGGKLSAFSKAFYEGKANMSEDETFGDADSSQSFMTDSQPFESGGESGGEVDFDYSPEGESDQFEGSDEDDEEDDKEDEEEQQQD